MESILVKIAEIYVPAKRRNTLDPDKVEAIAESILEEGQKMPIQVRRGNNRYVLIEGLHRLEAFKALGESSIEVLIVAARRH